MKLNITHDDNFLIAQKPAGFSTHAPDNGKLGFVEILAAELSQNLYVVHRLDKETSGIILFAQNTEQAEAFRLLFAQNKIHKQYLLLTSKAPQWSFAEVTSQISKDKNQFRSQNSEVKVLDSDQFAKSLSAPLEIDKNAVAENFSKTLFKKVKTHGDFCLLEAYPITGRPHQIRLHAQDFGSPILGDREHGGQDFVRLCLHAHQLQFSDRKFHSHAPEYFRDLSLIETEGRLPLYSALHRRQMLWQWQENESLRLFHQEGAALEIDQYGEVLWHYLYDEDRWQPEYLQHLQTWTESLGKQFVIRKMQNRGKDSQENTLLTSAHLPTRWTALENGKLFEVRTDSGLSPGLFLDQRQNRAWLETQVRDKTVLNLFSYTSLFSVGAALGGAKRVTTVDLSKSFIEWSKRNFDLNQIDCTAHEFWFQDVFLYLKGAAKRAKRFDWIVLDPPSFSRSKEGVFKIDRQLEELLQLCFAVLSEQGHLHFTLNYEQWDSQELQEQIQKCLVRLKLNKKAKFIKELRSGWDFELPNQPTLMKGFIIQFV